MNIVFSIDTLLWVSIAESVASLSLSVGLENLIRSGLKDYEY